MYDTVSLDKHLTGLARSIARRNPDFTVDDLRNEGWQAALEQLPKWEPARGPAHIFVHKGAKQRMVSLVLRQRCPAKYRKSYEHQIPSEMRSYTSIENLLERPSEPSRSQKQASGDVDRLVYTPDFEYALDAKYYG